MALRKTGRVRRWLRVLALSTMLGGVTVAPAEAAPVFGAVAAFAATQLGGIVVNAVIGIAFSFGAQLLKNIFGANNKQKPNLAMRLSLATGGVVPQSFIIGHWATSGSLNYRGSWGEADGTPNAYYVEERIISDLQLALSGFIYGEQRATILWDEPAEMGYPVAEARRNGVDHLWLRWRDGNQHTADAYLLNRFGGHPTRPYTGDMIGYGRASAIITRKVPNEDNRDLFPANLEYRFETTGIGLYDLSKDSTAGGFGSHRWNNPATWEHSSNPVVQIYNILRGIYAGDWLYGLQGLHPSRLPASSWIAAIHEADAPTPKADGSVEPQFRTGAEISVDIEPATVIEKLLAGCSGRIAEIGGVYKILIGMPGAAVMSFTDADIAVTKEQGFSPFPRIEQTYNGVRAKYVEPAANWELKDAPARYSPEHEDEDGGRRLVADVTLETVSSNTQVQRLIKAAAEEQRRWRRHRNGLAPIASELEPLDVVSWTSAHNGYIDKKFLVTEVEDEPTYLQAIDIQELDPADYDYDANTDERPHSVGHIGLDRPSPQIIIGFSVSPAIIYDQDGIARRPAVRFAWDGSVEDVRAVAFELRSAATEQLLLSDSTDHVSAGEALVTSAAILPSQQLEGRGKYLPRGPRATEWTGWMPVTTPDLGLSLRDIDEVFSGFLGFLPGALDDSLIGRIAQLREEIARLATITTDGAVTSNKQRRELKLELGEVSANFLEEIQVLVSADAALASQITTLDAAVGDNMAGIIAANIARVQGDQANATAITNLNAAFQSNVASVGTQLQALANTDSAQATQINQAVAQSRFGTAEGLFGVEAISGVAGVTSRLRGVVRTSINASLNEAGFFVDIMNGGTTRFAVKADQFYFLSASGSYLTAPFYIQSGVVYINNAVIQNLQTGNIGARQVTNSSSSVVPQTNTHVGSWTSLVGIFIPASTGQVTITASCHARSSHSNTSFGGLRLTKNGAQIATADINVDDEPTSFFGLNYIDENPSDAYWTFDAYCPGGMTFLQRFIGFTNGKR